MKTIKRGSEIKRVSDSKADLLVKKEGYSFCSKSEWKKSVRDISNPTNTSKSSKTTK